MWAELLECCSKHENKQAVGSSPEPKQMQEIRLRIPARAVHTHRPEPTGSSPRLPEARGQRTASRPAELSPPAPLQKAL